MLTKLNILNMALIGLILGMLAVERAGAAIVFEPQAIDLPFLNP